MKLPEELVIQMTLLGLLHLSGSEEEFWNIEKKPDQRQEALRYKAKHAQQAQGYSLLPEQDQMFPMLHQFFSNPARRHWTLARRVLNYIKSTQD